MAYTPVPAVSAGDWIDEVFINTYWVNNMAAGVPDVFSAKGQIAVGLGVDSMGVLNVGTDGDVLMADVAQTLGVKWTNLLNSIFGPQSMGLNYLISRTVAANNLTVALTDKNGNDASASNPITFRIHDALRTLTSALSLIVNAGSNYCLLGSSELAGKDTDAFVYIGWRVSDNSLFLIVSRIPWARTYGDFSTTLANEKYAIYSGAAPASTDRVECIGRVNVALSAAAAYQWSVPATDIVIHKPVYESRLLTWAPTITGYSSPPPLPEYFYQISGANGSGCAHFFIREGSNGTANAATRSYTLPFYAPGGTQIALPSPVDNNTSLAPGRISVSANTLVASKGDWTGWTASGASRIGDVNGRYKII